MPTITCRERDLVARETTTVTTIRMSRGPTAPWLARQHVRSGLPADLSAGRTCDLVLLTSELVTNAVEYSEAGPLDLTVMRADASTRIEVSNPNQSWARAPESHSPEPDQTAGWGLFLVEQLSDRWGTSDTDCTVWFEFDHSPSSLSDVWTVVQQVNYPATREEIVATATAAPAPTSVVTRLEALESECYEDAEAVSLELVDRRTESNPGLLAITAEVCERCGFSRKPCEPHSCIEEKALFSESVNEVTATFDRFDESTARQAVSHDLRSGEDRRELSMTVQVADERRRPGRRRGREGDVR
jgi:anti-sigma regulatory factor (Ser/Thr protein kinase)/predicted Zn-ribbon and HTH transcriptional regulator